MLSGGYIAAELAHVFASAGAQIIIVERPRRCSGRRTRPSRRSSPCTNLHRLRVGDLQPDSDHSTMQIDATTVPVPPALATLVRALTATAPSPPGRDELATRDRWLFPGRATRQPTAANVLARRLRRHGIAALPARHAARADWATEIPVPLAADVLGIHLSTAERWSQRVRRDWADYVADRAWDAAGGTQGAIAMVLPEHSHDETRG